MIYAILAVSVLINALLLWYGYKLMRKFLSYSENIYFLTDDMDSFVAHLEAIYELATFYGDETLQNLLLHSKSLKKNIEEFKQNSTLAIEEEEEEELIEYGEAEKEAGA